MSFTAARLESMVLPHLQETCGYRVGPMNHQGVPVLECGAPATRVVIRTSVQHPILRWHESYELEFYCDAHDAVRIT
jgi:hypothetical protein